MRLALPAQVKQAEHLVGAALAAGARLLGPPRQQGDNGDQRAYPSTIVFDACPEMALCQEASFAPLLAVLPFRTLEEALRMNARCPYALGASIFTSSAAHGVRLASHLRAGMVAINDVLFPTTHPATPFGGRGASGWGVTQGAEGLWDMTVPQVVSVRGGKLRPNKKGNPLVAVQIARAYALRDEGRALPSLARGDRQSTPAAGAGTAKGKTMIGPLTAPVGLSIWTPKVSTSWTMIASGSTACGSSQKKNAATYPSS
jgi:aldehyde dehydrogenase (NAD+)